MNKQSTTSIKRTTTGRTRKYKTRNGVYKTEEGNFQAKRMVNGVKFCKTFKRKRDAVTWLDVVTRTASA